MKKYLLTILLISIGFGQQNQDKELPFVNKSSFKSPKLYCTECDLSMRQTITRYVCRENHMSVEKSNVKIDKNGKLYIANSGNNEDEYVVGEYNMKIGAAFIAASGAMGLYMNNIEFDDVDEWYDYIQNDAKTYNNIRFGLLLIGGLFLLMFNL